MPTMPPESIGDRKRAFSGRMTSDVVLGIIGGEKQMIHETMPLFSLGSQQHYITMSHIQTLIYHCPPSKENQP
jgi:hypothetical protein